MTTSLAQIRDAAATVILQRHPELKGFVTFDAAVTQIHRGMHMIELRVYAALPKSICEIADSLEPHPYGPKREWPLGKILDHYCSHEPGTGWDFELGGLHWLIGDGDDSLAVTETGARSVTLWVRAWEE